MLEIRPIFWIQSTDTLEAVSFHVPTKIIFTVDLILATTPLQNAAQRPTSWLAIQLPVLVDILKNQGWILTVI